MKLRTIVLCLALLAFFSAATGGYFYFISFKKAAEEAFDMESVDQASLVQSRVHTFFLRHLKMVRALAGLDHIRLTVTSPDPISLAEAMRDMIHFQKSIEVDVCVLLDQKGEAVASTIPELIGKNFSFRPYFKEAMIGRAATYMAQGVITDARGFYFSSPVHDYTGKIAGVIVLRASPKELETMFREINDAIVMLVSPDDVVFAANRDEWLMKTLKPLIDEDTERLTQSRQFGKDPLTWSGLETLPQGRARMPDGSRYFIYRSGLIDYPGWSIVLIKDQASRELGMNYPPVRNVGWGALVLVFLVGLAVILLYQIASNDLANRRKAESELRKSEERFRSVVENSHEGIIIVDRNYRIIYINSEMSRILARNLREIEGKDFREFLDKGSRDLVTNNLSLWERGVTVPLDYELNALRPDGEKRWIRVTATAMAGASGERQVVAQILDITDRNMTVRALRESEEKHRTILEGMEEGYLEVDLSGNLVFFNHALCRVYGRSRDELLGLNYREYMDKEIARAVYQAYNRVYRTGQSTSFMAYEIIQPSGEKRMVEGSIALIRNDDGEPVGFRGLVRDMTDRIRAERALKLSEERYRTLLEANPDPVVVYEVDGFVSYINPAFTRVFGYTLQECQGSKVGFLITPHYQAELDMLIEKLRSEETLLGFESRRRTKNGDMIPVSISGSIFKDQEGVPRGLMVTIRDLSDQKRLESQLRQAQKMEAVGTLASGIAHDFNNLLQVMSGSLQLLISRSDKHEAQYRQLKDLELATNRATDLVKRLLTFSRKVKTELKTVDLAREITGTVKLLERTIPKMIRIETRLADDLRPINGDAGQLQQLIMNLAANAKDAMPEGGRFIIEAENVEVSDKQALDSPGLQTGPGVMITLTDTGLGMDEETLDHIFEPFYTTKSIGLGTGLGLSSVYGIVKAHGGHVGCVSRPGSGTSFIIHLPAYSKDQERNAYHSSSQTSQLYGRETVLLVDDEPSIRKIAAEALSEYGYTILEAENGEQAVEIYRRDMATINLVLLDLGMPGMGGRNCLRELIDINAQTKVIIASGYSDENTANAVLTEGAKGFLNKPYRLSDMLSLVRRTLDEPS